MCAHIWICGSDEFAIKQVHGVNAMVTWMKGTVLNRGGLDDRGRQKKVLGRKQQ